MSIRQLVIHGHFYQPPREEPWLELVPREISASPDHDWNERITRQCYEPLARARVVDASGRITRIVNAYEWCSFDIGPSLFRWFDTNAPMVSAAIIAGDRAAVARTGYGNAIAMPYHHVILPLMSRRDKVTEVRWGVRDFIRRFDRIPLGMWLPETAVDEETLEVLAEEKIRFTILSPNQVRDVPPFGRAGRWQGAAGSVALFMYDGPSAHDVAFVGALDDVTRWEANLTSFPLPEDGGPSVVSIATDGETFGHHHRLGDLALASLIDRIGARDDVSFTNFAAILAARPPEHDVALVSPSSWSCPHGIERWRSDCGCHYEPNTSQAWRAPLRQGLDTLADGLRAVVERDWPATGGDLWHAHEVAGPGLAGALHLPVEARRLLEILEHTLAMFTSCAWFFDDIGRLEPRIVLRHAARALELVPREDRATLEAALVVTLAQAKSNDPTKGDGAAIWHRDVLPESTGIADLAGALGALRELAPDALADVVMPVHTWHADGDIIVLHHIPTGEESRWRVAARTLGLVATRVSVTPEGATSERMITIAGFPAPVRRIIRNVATPFAYDAALSDDDHTRLQEGLLPGEAARERAFVGAVQLARRDGTDATIVVHAVLDLYEIEGEQLPDAARAEAFGMLARLSPSEARDQLAIRLGIVVP